MATPADQPPAQREAPAHAEEPAHTDEPPSHERSWQELVVTVLLVVAALGTSWSSYQATRWNGEQAAAASRTSAVRINAARAQGLAQAQTQVDVATFIAWANANRQGDHKLATFYVARFRDEGHHDDRAFADADAAPDAFADLDRVLHHPGLRLTDPSVLDAGRLRPRHVKGLDRTGVHADAAVDAARVVDVDAITHESASAVWRTEHRLHHAGAPRPAGWVETLKGVGPAGPCGTGPSVSPS